MTAWPALTLVTARPASTTIPKASLPGTCRLAESPRPKTGTGRPSAAKLVLKFGPVARIATRTRLASFGLRRGAGIVSTRSDSEGGPYRSRWIVRACIRSGRGVPRRGGVPVSQGSTGRGGVPFKVISSVSGIIGWNSLHYTIPEDGIRFGKNEGIDHRARRGNRAPASR